MIKAIKGVKDILPDQAPRWKTIEVQAHELAQRYGYSEIRIPIFERTELFARSIGGATDIVEKEMYTFQDRDGTSLTLRPEGTAGVVRAVLEHRLMNEASARKLYYLGPMFRHERPQAGRFRQFYQFGVESFGVADPFMDVETIAFLWQYFSELHLPNLTLLINSIGTIEDRRLYIDHLNRFLAPFLDHLCPNCRRRLTTNPLRVLDCKVPNCRSIIQQAPLVTDSLSKDSRVHFDHVLEGLSTLTIPFTIEPRLVRGLDYYSHTTFEITSPDLGAQSTIGAGGRYDTLVESLDGPSTPAVGFAVGLERVALLLPNSSIHPTVPPTFIAAFGPLGRGAGLKLLQDLRGRGIFVETDFRATTLKGLLRSADRLSSGLAVILGDDEVKKGTVLLRNMETKTQEEIPMDALPSRLKRENRPAVSPPNP